MSILQNKEQIQDIENSIDQYIFFEYMKNYSDLIEQLKPIAEGSGSTPHSLLMDYMFFKIQEERDKINQNKEQIQDIENSIDQYIFFEYMKNYSDLIEQLKPIAEGSGSTPHSLLMDYMFFKIQEERDKIHQDRLGV